MIELIEFIGIVFFFVTCINKWVKPEKASSMFLYSLLTCKFCLSFWVGCLTSLFIGEWFFPLVCSGLYCFYASR
jgi:uncharacterized membrane protein